MAKASTWMPRYLAVHMVAWKCAQASRRGHVPPRWRRERKSRALARLPPRCGSGAIPTANQAASIARFCYHRAMTIGIPGPGRKVPRQNAVVGLIIVALGGGLCLILLGPISHFLVDWLWFSSIGY